MADDAEAGPGEHPLISPSDIGNLLGLPILALIARLVPPGRAEGFCRAVAGLNARMLSADKAGLVRRIRALAGARTLGLPAAEIPDAVAGEDLLALLAVLRAHRTRSWEGRVKVEGRRHLDAALARGRGAILWRAHFVHYALPYYKALADLGYDFAQFSHVRHGFSNSRFGIRFLNPLRVGAEDLFVPARIERSNAAPTAALRQLYRRLDGNGIVSMSSRGDAGNFVEAPFMDGRHGVAPGAPHLAYVKGAALLPVFPIREAGGAHRIVIEPPIPVDADRPRRAAIEAAATDFAGRLETQVRAHPSQWLGWMHL
ncbi:MAG: lysophospholipid acyltransferase family protein [Magnetovibrio sp.]|nr:lysophospholipid acyltransferase family protein [Magnetovibrio sp.]